MMMYKTSTLVIVALIAAVIGSCQNSSVENKASVIKNFDINRYLGTWYEIARFDFRFEKDLKTVTAHYAKRDDGMIKVVNRGYNYVNEEWEEAIGKAKFRDRLDEAALAVSFFGPFYSEYNVVSLDSSYQYALIFGKNTDYIWFLSRHKTMPEDVKAEFIAKAEQYGYDLTKLIWTEQE